MKKYYILLLGLLLPMLAGAQSSAEYVEGFIGHPFLKANGYKAETGFTIDVGGGNVNPDHVVDNNPDNCLEGINLVSATVAYDEIIKILPDPSITSDPRPIAPGELVGFLIEPSNSDVKVLGVKVIDLFVFNFYNKDGRLLGTQVANNQSSNILGVSLISVGSGKEKIVCPVPEYDEEVYGFGLSRAGVEVKAGVSVKVYYAFADDFEEVPIIKKYFPNATGEVEGMAWSGSNLVNNDLSDGATTSVNIGGTFYSVYRGNNETFPKGVEAGWVMTAGALLDLSLGSAIQIKGIYLDENGKEKEDVITTFVDVVNLGLISGGKSCLSFITPYGEGAKEYIGFKLSLITVIDLNLGAKAVNYAYIKLPELPKPNVPFDAGIEAVPNSVVKNYTANILTSSDLYNAELGSNPYLINRYKTDLLFSNGDENPLCIPSQTPEDVKSTIWGEKSLMSVLRTHEAVQLSFSRAEVNSDGTIGKPTLLGWFDIVWTGSNAPIGYKDNTLYYRTRKPGFLTPTTIKDWTELSYEEDGKVYLNELSFTEENDYKIRKSAEEGEDNLIGFEYRLYYVNPGLDVENLVNGIELDYSSVTVPTCTPEFELAGTLDYIRDIKTDVPQPYNPESFVDANKHQHYVSFIIPDNIDFKTHVEKVKIYRYFDDTYHNRELIQTFTRDYENNDWTSDELKVTEPNLIGNKSLKGKVVSKANWVHINGTTKMVVMLLEPGTQNDFGVQITLGLNDDYVQELVEEFGGEPSKYTDGRTLEYVWRWNGEGTYNQPTLVYDNTHRSLANNGSIQLYANWHVELNDAVAIHNDPRLSGAADEMDDFNVDIYYNQWYALSGLRTYAQDLQILAGEPPVNQNVLFSELVEANNHVLASTTYGDDISTHALLTAVSVSESDVLSTTTYNTTTRAYIPVVPAYFENYGLSEDIQTYIVLDNYSPYENIMDSGLTGVESVSDNVSDAPAEYYNTLGVKVSNPSPGIYIVRRGNVITKEVVF